MKSWLLLTGLLAFPFWKVQAQQLRLAYFGETVTHYGLKAGYERPLKSYLKPNSTVRKEFLAIPGVAFYRHPSNHLGLIVSPEFAYRRTGRRGGQFEVALSPGYFRYFHEGKTVEVGEDGQFRKVPLAGGNAFLPTVSVGFGRDLSVRRAVPLSWYARLNVMQQRPYNASSLIRFGLEAGIIKPLKKS